MSNLDKKIIYLSEAYHGSCHDYAIMKKEFDYKHQNWFEDEQIWVDLGFLGIQKDYDAEVMIPFKKPKNGELTQQQKQYNQSVSRVRVKIEHVIAGLKKYRILSDKLRLKDFYKYNQIMGICAAIWNFNLTY